MASASRILNLLDATAQQEPATLAQLNQKAPLVSPALTGSPTINGVAAAIITDVTDKVPAGIKFRISGTDLQTSIDNGVNWKTVTLT